jgi:hypothetical protein
MSRLSHAQLALELAACVQQLSAFLDLPDCEDDEEGFEIGFARVGERAERLLEGISKPKVGRGKAKVGRRAPKVEMPSQLYYDSYIRAPEAFTNLCGHGPAEFEDLHNDVLDVLRLSRNSDCRFTEEENGLRKKRHFKFSSRERLFHFLMFCRHYPTFRKGGADVGMSKAALRGDFVWLRAQLKVHPLLVAEVQWPGPAALEAERLLLVEAGLLGPGFETCVYMCDGTKDLGRRNAHYGHKHEPDYSQKGNGKTHLLFTNLFGKPMMCAAGIQGCENDPAAYQMTHIYRDPDAYLLPNHSGLFDGVFQNALHVNTTEPGVLPASQPELRKAAPPMRKMLARMNKQQRHLRCPIEQTFGMIKQWGIVSDTVFRGSLDQQGDNFLLCTQLTARLMRVRDQYPRGAKWMRGEKEAWEEEWERDGWLYIDPLHPELYV